ncbi:nucleotidyl transferase AbiEii/AbiGii toxin family protein [Thermophilibacter sp. ZX-H3]|uniref:nucleotidyl transferase AbiEii/AbiGii toxin family protein n=1 Tax=Atopobiaceae TaxID=1643824 RepID=UPI001439E5F6|nr:nucleotidyl transferase AbiEii/AbiGii toxin family protein [Olsenella sp. SW781]
MSSSMFSEFARGVAARHQLGTLLPVVEKELLHYDILAALDASGWLKRLVFQGGTCLRLCYGNVRYSENLDFTTPDELIEIDLAGFAQVLSQALDTQYHLGVRVKEPTSVKAFSGGGSLKRWQIIVDTAPERPDLPSQRIKIEIARIPSYDTSMRFLAINYPELPRAFANMLVRCQSADEILAGKLISFANSSAAPRYRDLWDIPWIVGNHGWHMDEVARMVGLKHVDYGCSRRLLELLESGRARALALATSREFADQMARFVPREAFEKILGVPGYAEALATCISETYSAVTQRLCS